MLKRPCLPPQSLTISATSQQQKKKSFLFLIFYELKYVDLLIHTVATLSTLTQLESKIQSRQSEFQKIVIYGFITEQAENSVGVKSKTSFFFQFAREKRHATATICLSPI